MNNEYLNDIKLNYLPDRTNKKTNSEILPTFIVGATKFIDSEKF